jgi:hypothetical protein
MSTQSLGGKKKKKKRRRRRSLNIIALRNPFVSSKLKT